MAPALRARSVGKKFRIYRKDPGLWGSLRGLFRRRYEENQAVRAMTLDIERGEIVGLLGENGAGKTTFMKLATGIIMPSSGSLEVLGAVPFDRTREFRRHIALVMGQKSQLWWDLPALDSLQLLKRFYELEDKAYSQRVGELSELLGTGHVLRVPLRKLSLGERMKVELMACLLHQPSFLFLDEPTIGLDLVAQRRIRQFLRDYHQQHQLTILLTSHYMADIEALCQRVVLMNRGEKRFDGSREAFASVLGSEKLLTFTFAEAPPQDDPLFTENAASWKAEGTEVELKVPAEQVGAIGAAILARYPATAFGTEKLPIERVMHRLLEKPELLPRCV